MKSLRNSTGEEECSKLVFSSSGPVLEELVITEIPLQSAEPALSSESERRVDWTHRHCAPSLDLDLADRFHPILHPFHHLYHLLLHLQTYMCVCVSLSLSSSGNEFVRLKFLVKN